MILVAGLRFNPKSFTLEVLLFVCQTSTVTETVNQAQDVWIEPTTSKAGTEPLTHCPIWSSVVDKMKRQTMMCLIICCLPTQTSELVLSKREFVLFLFVLGCAQPLQLKCSFPCFESGRLKREQTTPIWKVPQGVKCLVFQQTLK